jgi:hypothetical protein
VHGAAVGIGSGTLSKVDAIHLKNASMPGSSQQWGAAIGAGIAENSRKLFSEITSDCGNFALCRTSADDIRIAPAKVNIRSDVSAS